MKEIQSCLKIKMKHIYILQEMTITKEMRMKIFCKKTGIEAVFILRTTQS